MAARPMRLAGGVFRSGMRKAGAASGSAKPIDRKIAQLVGVALAGSREINDLRRDRLDEHTDSKGREFGEMTAALGGEFASSSLLPQRVPASRLLPGGARRAQGNDQDAVQKIDALTIGIERETQHPPRNE